MSLLLSHQPCRYYLTAGVSQLLPHHLRLVGIRLRPELLHASVEDLREVQVTVLIGRDRVRAVELARLAARAAPPVQVLPGQIVFDDPVRPAVRLPQELVGRDEVRVRLRANAG